jgi:hypothetical protein
MTTRTHPDSAARWQLARSEGAAADAGYSQREYALTLCVAQGIVTFAQCHFDNPQRTMQRVLAYRARHGY